LRAKNGKISSPSKAARFGGEHRSVSSSVDDNVSPVKARGPSSPTREIDGINVSPTRGSLLGPFNFMTANLEHLHSEELSKSEMMTIHRQLVLLRLQMKYKNNEDRILSKDQVLQAWYFVTEQEEKTFLMQRKLEEFGSIVTGQRKLEDMERQVEKTYESLAPTFEKLAKFNEIKNAQKDRRAFLKSTKSFRAKASINQEYSQKILDLEKAVRHIERMNEKKVRLNKSTVSASAHRINSMNSMRKDSSPAILSQRSSFVERNEPIQQRKVPQPVIEQRNSVPAQIEVPVQVAVPATSQEIEKPLKTEKVIKLTDSPLRSAHDPRKYPEKENATIRRIEEPIAKSLESSNGTAKVKDALNSLRAAPVLEKAGSQPIVEKEFQQLQLNQVTIPAAKSIDEKPANVRSILEMAKSSLRQIEKSEEGEKSNHVEESKDTGLPAVQLRKIDSIDAVAEEPIRNESESALLFATKRDSLRVVPNKRGSMVSTVEVPVLIENKNASSLDLFVEQEQKLDEKVEIPAMTESSSVVDQTAEVGVVENSRHQADAVIDLAARARNFSLMPGSPGIARSNSDRSKDSQQQGISVPALSQRPSSVRGSNFSIHEDDAESDTSRLSSRSNISLKQAKESVSSSATLKNTLRPTPVKDPILRHEVDDQEQDPSENILRAKEHLHPVVMKQDNGREEDSHRWAAPILQAKETLRPIVREKDLPLKEPSSTADPSTEINERAGDASASSPTIVKEAVSPPATEFERKASVFGKLVRKMSGLMDRNTAVAMSPALAAQNQQGNEDKSGAALFEAAVAGEVENHSESRTKVRDASYDPTNRHHDHDDDDEEDDNAIVNDDDFLGDLSTAPSSMLTHKIPKETVSPGSDVKLVSLTKANLERTLSQRAEVSELMGPGATFRESFSTGQKNLSFIDENQAQHQITPGSKPMSPDSVDRNASFTLSAAVATTLIENSSQRQIVAQEASPKDPEQETASQVTGSETESQIKKRKSGMNFMKGLRKRTSSIFGSKSGSNLDIATDSNDSPSGGAMMPTVDAFSPTRRSSAISETSSDLGPDDSASQTDKRKKSGGFSNFIRSTSMFRRSKSGNYTTGNANEVVIPEDEEVNFSEPPTPIGGLEKIMTFDHQQDEVDETGSQISTASEKKRRLTMKGLMKRTSSLFKK
jgi:hypothetical protein